MKKLFILLLFIPNLCLKANQDELKLPLITLNNYSEKCKPSFKKAYLNNLYKSLPKEKSTKGLDFSQRIAVMQHNSAIWKRRSNLSTEYSQRCASYCGFMKKIKPTNEGFIYSGNYGSTDAALCNDRWVKKINKKGNRVEFVWGETNRIRGLEGRPQTISGKYNEFRTFIVNCSTWEEWNKSDKIWEPISKGKIVDDGAEKFCKRSFFGLGSF